MIRGKTIHHVGRQLCSNYFRNGSKQMSSSQFVRPSVWNDTYSIGIDSFSLSERQKISLSSILEQNKPLTSTSRLSINGQFMSGKGAFHPTFSSPIGGVRTPNGQMQLASSEQLAHVSSCFGRPSTVQRLNDHDFHTIKMTIERFIKELKSSDMLLPDYLAVAAQDFRAEKWNEFEEFIVGTIRNMIASAEVTQNILQTDPNLEVGATHFVSLANQNFPTILVFEAMMRHLLLGKDVMVIARPASSDTSHFPIHLVQKFQDFCVQHNVLVNNQPLVDRLFILCVSEGQRDDFLTNHLSQNNRAIVNVVGSANTVQTIYNDSLSRGYGVEVAGAGLTTMIIDGDNYSSQYINTIADLVEASKFVAAAKQCTALQDIAILFPIQNGFSNQDLLLSKLADQSVSENHQNAIADAYKDGGFKHNSSEMNPSSLKGLDVVSSGGYNIVKTPKGGTPESDTWGTNLIGIDEFSPSNARLMDHIRKHHLSLGLYLTNDTQNIAIARHALQSITGPTVISIFMAACFSQPPLGEGFRENAMKVEFNSETNCTHVTILSEWAELVPFHTDQIVTTSVPEMPINIQPILHMFKDIIGSELTDNEFIHLAVFANELASFTQPPYVSNLGRSEVAVQYVYPDHDHMTFEMDPTDRLDALMKLMTIMAFRVDQHATISFRLPTDFESHSTAWEPFKAILVFLQGQGVNITLETLNDPYKPGVYIHHQTTNPFKDGSRKTLVNVLNSIGFGPRQVKVSNTHYSQSEANTMLHSIFDGVSFKLNSTLFKPN